MRSLLFLGLLATNVQAQSADRLAAERADFQHWLETSPISPYAAIYHQPFSGELVFGPEGEPSLSHMPPARLDQGLLRLKLETEDGDRTMPLNRPVDLGDWRLRVSGERGRRVVTVFGDPGEVTVPGWYPWDATYVIEGVLDRSESGEERRMLGLDGIEVEATLAGTFRAELLGDSVSLLVYRMPIPGLEEAEMNIFFRDATNGEGTYPAGRFLALTPLGRGRYRADFNRTRNPFCAYNTVFPCPLPWRGNVIEARVEAGEKYGR